MSKIDQRDWKQFLAHLSKRDGGVELAPRGASADDTRKVYKSRLFEVSKDGEIIVERPDQSVLDHAFRVGDTIELLLVVNNQRMLGDCELREVAAKQINRATRVTCFKLGPAKRIRPDQRRSFFRVNTAGADLGTVSLLAHGKDIEDEVRARMVNLGGGGMGVSIRASRDLLREIQGDTKYRCRLEIQSDNEVIDLDTTLVHLSPLDTTGLYLGLRFELPEGKEGKALESRLVQYGAWLQRQQLKRRRA
ncbi:PilZ domain-containing protein [Phycisphaeraceae bacterium D3-23]